MKTNTTKRTTNLVNRLVAATVATMVTVAIFVGIQALSAYYAAGPLAGSAAQLAA